MVRDLNGIFPALLTPLDASDRVDEGALAALVEQLLAEGAEGFYLTGSTAECHLLTAEERMRIVAAALRTLNGRATAVVHVGTPGTELSCTLARHAADHGADALSAVPPFYYKYSFAEIRSHYEAIVRATGKPMIVYNFPALSGVNFTVDNFRTLAENPLVAGVKHTSYDLYQLERIGQAVPRWTLYNGHDEVFLAGLVMGAKGAIGSTFNYMLPKFQRIAEHVRGGRLDAAKVEQTSANRVIEAMLAAGSFPAMKYLVGRKGVPCGGCRAPTAGLADAGLRKLEAVFPELRPVT